MERLAASAIVGLVCALLAGCEETPKYDDYSSRTRAPGVDVMHKRDGGVRVRAPGVYVETHGYEGRPEGTKVTAPLTKVETDAEGGKRVKAPFTDSDTRQPPVVRMVPYTDRKGFFTLAVPAGWRLPAPGEAAANFQDPSGRAGVKVLVLTDRRYETSDLKATAQRFTAQWEPSPHDLKRVSTRDCRLAGQPAVRTDVAYMREGVPTRGAMIVSIQDGRAVSLTIRADTRSYEGFGPMLEQIVESYRSGAK